VATASPRLSVPRTAYRVPRTAYRVPRSSFLVSRSSSPVPSSETAVPATLGVRVKSGWAAVVLIGGSARAPVVLDSRRIELADAAIPESVQPYHAGFGHAQRDQRTVGRLVRLVERCARESIRSLVGEYEKSGYALLAAAVVGTSRTDPATIGNPHIRIHALEGRLFRRVVEEGLAASRVPCTPCLESEIYAEAPRLLRRTAPDIRRELTMLGRETAGAWRAEQKSAALAAWLTLATKASLEVTTQIRPGTKS
jgi:hypothetical protein